MRIETLLIILLITITACSKDIETTVSAETKSRSPIFGTWKLLSAQTIVSGDTTFKSYTKEVAGVKIINDTHFSFHQHDLTHGADSAALYVSGGGKYILENNHYTEFLEYCSARSWENHKFDFEIKINDDTLIQTGVEQIASLGVNRTIVETYVRTNNINTPVPIMADYDSVEVAWFKQTGLGTIKGLANFKSRSGEVRSGSEFGLELMPASGYAKDRLKKLYPNDTSDFLYLEDGVPKFIPDEHGYHETVRKTTCNANGEFQFTDLPKGEYYLMAFMIWDKGSTKDGGGIMRRITLGASETKEVKMTNF